AIGDEQPALVILDDFHAADEATRRLLSSLPSCLTGRVMFLLTADGTRGGPGPRLSAPLGTRGLRQGHLGELTAADVEAMLGSLVEMAQSPRRALAARLHTESGGLPRDICDLVTALVEERLLTPDTGGGSWRLSPVTDERPLPLPATVRERGRARLAQLSPV